MKGNSEMQVRFNPEDEAPPETYRLVYGSRRIQNSHTPELSELINDILENARENNRQTGISGVLLFDTRSFAQVIEGPPKAVKNLFGQIICDPRHTAVTVQEHGLIPGRAFTKWVMAFVTPLSQVDLEIPSDMLAGGNKEARRILNLLMALLRDQAKR
jgi:hypothetical protein